MEPTTTYSVQRGPAWNQGGSGSPAAPNDPLAFFDLIMNTAQKMSAIGGDRNNPLAATGPQDPFRTESATSNSHWQDDRHKGTAPVYEASASTPAATEPTSTAASNDVAAVTDFSDQREEDQDDPASDDLTPDDAALATAGAATQQQLLGAPDTLTSAEAHPSAGEETGAGNPLPVTPDAMAQSSDARADLENNQPLDTAEEMAGDNRGLSGLDAASDTVKNKAHDQATAAAELAEGDGMSPEAEVDPSDKSQTDPRSNRAHLKEREAEQELAAAESERNANDSGHRESSRDGESSVNTARDKSAKAKPSAAETSQPTAAAPDPTANTAVPKPGQESVLPPAAGPAAVAPANTASHGGSASGEQGAAGITSLLQRGLQRGTLQKAGEGRPTAGLDAKQQVRLVNRVARAVETTPPGQAIKIRLNPAELGALKVEIKIENGNLTARIEAENASTRQVLMENLPQLRERLAEVNIQVQQFEVDLMGQESPSDRGASHLGDEGGREDSGSSKQNGSERGGGNESDSEAPPTRRVNKEAERESRNLNVTI